ncbi:hypothetical protein H6S82_06040 [Planktothrix sp. FACHB-1355]|uniref:Uncharacterized protein n=1 Tax=Aerosakkonema funiforme FACHB-1375 TaxID=2949571 RepID=A0A926ZEL5_9CYAN|nr:MULTISPECIES: hypothetical protein [Oscillatoriales]MBD2179885.1 hypothetical protein [Aerosakkonema funiforme FACHB-1375]MBD3558415.1 hypothetical protein [Planktothrix sp. FACHB-1355]
MKKKVFLVAAIGCLTIPIGAAGLFGSVADSSVNAQQFISGSTAIAQRTNQVRNPDEPINVTLNERFSLANSLMRIKQIQGALTSFRTLTARSKPKLGQTAIATIGNTDPETQTLGFTNWVGAVEGTVRQQNYQIKKLEFELAKKQFEDKQISQTAFNQKRAAYQQAEREFQNFLNSFRIVD